MKILVLQHVVSEHPGVLRNFLREDGLSWDTIELDEGQEIPDLEPYDLMIVMGGPTGCVGGRSVPLDAH
jgi:GMP synthase-like glutamine amidotransferase